MSTPSILQRHSRFSALLVLLTSVITCGTLRSMENNQPLPSAMPFTVSSTPLAQLSVLGEGTVNALAWSPDGKWMAVGGSLGIHLYDAATLQEVRYVETREAVSDLVFSPDGHTLAAASQYTTLSLWDVDTGQPFQVITETEAIGTFRLSSDGRTLATEGYYGVHVWDIASGRLVRTLGEEGVLWNTISFSLDSCTAYAEGSGQVASAWKEVAGVWDLSTGEWLYTLESAPAHDVAFSPDGTLLAVSSYATGEFDTIKVLDARTGRLLSALDGPWNSRFLTFSPDGRQLATGSSDNVVQIWNVTTGQVFHTLGDPAYSSKPVAFSPDGHFLAVWSDDSTMQLWDTATGQIQVLYTLQDLGRRPSPALSPDGRVLAVSTNVGRGDGIDIHLFDAHTGQILRTFESQLLNSIALTSDERLFVSRPDETTAWRWHAGVQHLALLNAFPGSRLMTLSPDDRQLALVDAGGPTQDWNTDESIQIWDTATGRPTHTLVEGPRARVSGMAFSPDGNLLASTMVTSSRALSPSLFYESYSPVHLWDAETGALLAVHRGYPEAISLETFATGERLFTTRCTGDSCSRRSCDLATWDVDDLVSRGDDAAPLWSNRDFDLPVQDTMLNPDRTVVIALLQDTGCGPSNAAVVAWDVETGRKLLNLSFDFKRPVSSIALSPAGTVIAVGTRDGSLGQWDLHTGQRLHTIEGLTSGATRLAYSPEGRWLASGNDDGKIQLWSTQSGQLLHTQAGHTLAITGLLFSPDGHTLYSASDDGTARIWEIAPESLAAIQEALPITSVDYVTLPIAAFANGRAGFQSPPTGYVTLEGVPFRLSDQVFKSQASTPPYDFYPTSILLEENIPHAQKVHLLLNTGNGFTEFDGQAIGQVVAHCNDTPTVVANLQLGQEIREWHAAANVVSTATHARQVWSGYILSTPDETGYIDMLSLDLPAACQEGWLTAIEVIDTSSDIVSSLDPALNLFGATVEYRQ